jgi:hypothetical protein
MKEIIKKNPLFFAFLLPALVDGTVTLLGQNPEYWSNKVVNEASPAYYFLLTSPWLFLVGSLVWFVFWYWLFKKLKEPYNLFFMFLFIAGHSWGSSSWIWKIMKENGLYVSSNQGSVIIAWSIVVVYFALMAFFATYGLRLYFSNKNERD